MIKIPDLVIPTHRFKDVPAVPGCYGFWSGQIDSYLRIGTSGDLNNRLRKYFAGGSLDVHIAALKSHVIKLGTRAKLHIWFVEDSSRLDHESFLIKEFNPFFNQHRIGIRLLMGEKFSGGL